MPVIPGPPYAGLYQHYKGDIYVVRDIIMDQTNTDRDPLTMVLYKSLHTNETYVREIKDFNEHVHPEDGSASYMHHMNYEIKDCPNCVPRFHQLLLSEIMIHNIPKIL